VATRFKERGYGGDLGKSQWESSSTWHVWDNICLSCKLNALFSLFIVGIPNPIFNLHWLLVQSYYFCTQPNSLCRSFPQRSVAVRLFQSVLTMWTRRLTTVRYTAERISNRLINNMNFLHMHLIVSVFQYQQPSLQTHHRVFYLPSPSWIESLSQTMDLFVIHSSLPLLIIRF
jgi:hypothetical protein